MVVAISRATTATASTTSTFVNDTFAANGP
jgi:hypothetical protein